MSYKPRTCHHRSTRLKEYDYTQAGAYYVSSNTQKRLPMFGNIVDGEMVLNDAGRMVQAVWEEIPAHYPGVEIDEFIVMPDHIHGIVILVESGPSARPQSGPRTCLGEQGPEEPAGEVAQILSLPDVMQRFKSLTTKRYIDGVKQHGWPPFPGKLWQRSYYEHIVRNEKDLNRIREYILQNPLKWGLDHPGG